MNITLLNFDDCYFNYVYRLSFDVEVACIKNDLKVPQIII